MSLTAKRLRKLLHYDPITGFFTAKITCSTRVKGTILKPTGRKGYWKLRVDGRSYQAHCLAWLYMTSSWAPSQIDHKDTNKSNNAWINLRLATPSEQQANTHKRRNKSGYKGVTWGTTSKRWLARVKKNGKFVHSSRHATPEAAHAAYVEAAIKAFGSYARF